MDPGCPLKLNSTRLFALCARLLAVTRGGELPDRPHSTRLFASGARLLAANRDQRKWTCIDQQMFQEAPRTPVLHQSKRIHYTLHEGKHVNHTLHEGRRSQSALGQIWAETARYRGCAVREKDITAMRLLIFCPRVKHLSGLSPTVRNLYQARKSCTSRH